jgi:hypothetical protein
MTGQKLPSQKSFNILNMVWPCKGKNPCSVDDFKSYFEEFGD